MGLEEQEEMFTPGASVEDFRNVDLQTILFGSPSTIATQESKW